MTILSATLRGVEARVVSISVSRGSGPAGVHITGLAAAAERECRVRVAAALANADRFVDKNTEVSLDAGGRAIDGTAVDLATALAVASTEPPTKRIAAFAELSLAGEVRPVRGVLAAVEALKGHADVVLVAHENGAEAALVNGIRVLAVRHLIDALRFVGGDERAASIIPSVATRAPASTGLDMRDVAGNARARRALEIAATGCHHLLLVGPPGAGKTMLARRLPSIMPPLTEEEALAVTRVHSAAGLNVGGGLVSARPFRAPHHSTTPPGLVGGGAALPRPGEVSLAHHGVLFLDELPEFARPALEVLPEPLATKEVVLARASGTLRFPSNCLVVASTPPCPCGRFGDRRCACSLDSRKRYLGRIPERLLAHFDLRVELEHVDLGTIGKNTTSESSSSIAARVVAARTQLGHLEEVAARAVAASTAAATATREALTRAARIARTIAALDGCGRVEERHFIDALSFTREP